MKNKLIILSDLWGETDNNWIAYYTTFLKEKFANILVYDVCKLAEIDISSNEESIIHQQFIEKGIDKAVKNLIEKEREEVFALGFSIGGLILWKSSLLDLNTNHLFAVSSTRLRYEEQKPKSNINLFYAENDQFKPASNWFENHQLQEHLFSNESHEFYRKENIAKQISKEIIKNVR